jgi:uncharacterized protein
MIRRIFNNATVRAEMTGEIPTEISGVGAVVGVVTDLGYCEESIAEDAFKDADLSEVLVCFNHDLDTILGKNTAGTAVITVAENGDLLYKANKLDLENPEVVAPVRYIMRGEVDKASFMFDIESEMWETSVKYGAFGKRTITKVKKVYECGPVTLPAYEETSAYAREKDSILQSRSKFIETTETEYNGAEVLEHYKRKLQTI